MFEALFVFAQLIGLAMFILVAGTCVAGILIAVVLYPFHMLYKRLGYKTRKHGQRVSFEELTDPGHNPMFDTLIYPASEQTVPIPLKGIRNAVLLEQAPGRMELSWVRHDNVYELFGQPKRYADDPFNMNRGKL